MVEDDAGVRTIAHEALTSLGYRVLEAATPTEALRLLKERDDIQLLFTDVVLPEMNGRILAEQAALLRPGLKVIITSGYTQNAIVHNGRLDAGLNFIGKPFKLDALGKKLRAVLDEI